MMIETRIQNAVLHVLHEISHGNMVFYDSSIVGIMVFQFLIMEFFKYFSGYLMKSVEINHIKPSNWF